MDREISNEFQKILSKQGIQNGIKSRVIRDQGNSVLISYTSVKNQKVIRSW